MSKKLEELIELTKLWFKDVGLLEKGTPLKQAEKSVEEATEYLEAVISGDRGKMVDELGDNLVTIIGNSLINNIYLEINMIYKYYDLFVKSGVKYDTKECAEKSLQAFKRYRDSISDNIEYIQPYNFYDSISCTIRCSVANDIPLEEALYFAYCKIQNRVGKGEIVDGSFVKEEDLK